MTTASGTTGAERIRFNPIIANSGAAAIGMAAMFGARRIIMLGYDCTVGPAGQRHWHGDHPAGLGNAGSIQKWPGIFDNLRKHVPARVEVVNASRKTILQTFPRVSLEEVLKS